MQNDKSEITFQKSNPYEGDHDNETVTYTEKITTYIEDDKEKQNDNKKIYQEIIERPLEEPSNDNSTSQELNDNNLNILQKTLEIIGEETTNNTNATHSQNVDQQSDHPVKKLTKREYRSRPYDYDDELYRRYYGLPRRRDYNVDDEEFEDDDENEERRHFYHNSNFKDNHKEDFDVEDEDNDDNNDEDNEDTENDDIDTEYKNTEKYLKNAEKYLSERTDVPDLNISNFQLTEFTEFVTKLVTEQMKQLESEIKAHDKNNNNKSVNYLTENDGTLDDTYNTFLNQNNTKNNTKINSILMNKLIERDINEDLSDNNEGRNPRDTDIPESNSYNTNYDYYSDKNSQLSTDQEDDDDKYYEDNDDYYEFKKFKKLEKDYRNHCRYEKPFVLFHVNEDLEKKKNDKDCKKNYNFYSGVNNNYKQEANGNNKQYTNEFNYDNYDTDSPDQKSIQKRHIDQSSKFINDEQYSNNPFMQILNHHHNLNDNLINNNKNETNNTEIQDPKNNSTENNDLMYKDIIIQPIPITYDIKTIEIKDLPEGVDTHDTKISEDTQLFKITDILDNSDKIKKEIELMPSTVMFYVIDNFFKIPTNTSNPVITNDEESNNNTNIISSRKMKRDLRQITENLQKDEIVKRKTLKPNKRHSEDENINKLNDIEKLIAFQIEKCVNKVINERLSPKEKEIIDRNTLSKIINQHVINRIVEQKNNLLTDYHTTGDVIESGKLKYHNRKYHEVESIEKPCINIKNLNIFYELGDGDKECIHIPSHRMEPVPYKLLNYEKRNPSSSHSNSKTITKIPTYYDNDSTEHIKLLPDGHQKTAKNKSTKQLVSSTTDNNSIKSETTINNKDEVKTKHEDEIAVKNEIDEVTVNKTEEDNNDSDNCMYCKQAITPLTIDENEADLISKDVDVNSVRITKEDDVTDSDSGKITATPDEDLSNNNPKKTNLNIEEKETKESTPLIKHDDTITTGIPEYIENNRRKLEADNSSYIKLAKPKEEEEKQLLKVIGSNTNKNPNTDVNYTTETVKNESVKEEILQPINNDVKRTKSKPQKGHANGHKKQTIHKIVKENNSNDIKIENNIKNTEQDEILTKENDKNSSNNESVNLKNHQHSSGVRKPLPMLLQEFSKNNRKEIEQITGESEKNNGNISEYKDNVVDNKQARQNEDKKLSILEKSEALNNYDIENLPTEYTKKMDTEINDSVKQSVTDNATKGSTNNKNVDNYDTFRVQQGHHIKNKKVNNNKKPKQVEETAENVKIFENKEKTILDDDIKNKQINHNAQENGIENETKKDSELKDVPSNEDIMKTDTLKNEETEITQLKELNKKEKLNTNIPTVSFKENENILKKQQLEARNKQQSQTIKDDNEANVDKTVPEQGKSTGDEILVEKGEDEDYNDYDEDYNNDAINDDGDNDTQAKKKETKEEGDNKKEEEKAEDQEDYKNEDYNYGDDIDNDIADKDDYYKDDDDYLQDEEGDEEEVSKVENYEDEEEVREVRNNEDAEINREDQKIPSKLNEEEEQEEDEIKLDEAEYEEEEDDDEEEGMADYNDNRNNDKLVNKNNQEIKETDEDDEYKDESDENNEELYITEEKEEQKQKEMVTDSTEIQEDKQEMEKEKVSKDQKNIINLEQNEKSQVDEEDSKEDTEEENEEKKAEENKEVKEYEEVENEEYDEDVDKEYEEKEDEEYEEEEDKEYEGEEEKDEAVTDKNDRVVEVNEGQKIKPINSAELILESVPLEKSKRPTKSVHHGNIDNEINEIGTNKAMNHEKYNNNWKTTNKHENHLSDNEEYVRKSDVKKMIMEMLNSNHRDNDRDNKSNNKMFYSSPETKYNELVKDIASYFAKKNVSVGDDICIYEEYGSKHGDNDLIYLSGTKLYQNGVPKKDAQNFNLIIKKPTHTDEHNKSSYDILVDHTKDHEKYDNRDDKNIINKQSHKEGKDLKNREKKSVRITKRNPSQHRCQIHKS